MQSVLGQNELELIYLFGVLHDIFDDFRIQSIQQLGFPDCIARRKVGKDRWEEVRIEFEYESRNFFQHAHPSDGVDIIVCWKHNWAECPKEIEVIELCKLPNQIDGQMRSIEQVEVKKKLLQENQLPKDYGKIRAAFQETARNEKYGKGLGDRFWRMVLLIYEADEVSRSRLAEQLLLDPTSVSRKIRTLTNHHLLKTEYKAWLHKDAQIQC